MVAYEPKGYGRKSEFGSDSGSRSAFEDKTEQHKPRENNPSKLARMCTLLSFVTVAAVGFGLFAFVSSAHKYAVFDGATEAVVVANREVAAGQTLSQADVDVKDVPRAAVPASAAHELDEVLGKLALSTLSAGAVVDRVNVSGEVAANLAGRIAEGKVALSIAVTQQTGVSGLVRQGDKVTLFGADAELAKGAKVLAVDSKLDAPSSEYTSLTVELAPNDAREVALALESGSVAVAVEQAAAEG